MPSDLKTSKQEKLLGSDMAVDSNGNFAIQYRNGYRDYASIKGKANLNQALMFRLRAIAKQLSSRLPGSLPAHQQYGVGIITFVSGPNREVIEAARARILSNFNDEPRIKPIQTNDITFTWNSSTRYLQIAVSYKLINDEIPQNLIFPIYIR